MESRLDDKILLKMSLDALQQNQMANAIWFMQQAAEIAPEIILYKRNLGELLRRAGQLEAAISSLKIAISMEPHCAENYFLLGLAYNDNRQFELAIHYYHIAISYEYNYVMAWNNLGASLESMNDRKNAKVAYTTAIALNPKHAEAQNNLGAIYSEENQLDKAHTHFTAAITANPAFIDAHYNLSLIKTYTPNDPHLNFLESINQKIDHYPHLTRIRYYFTLGKALDDTKQYTPAFKAYAEGNRLHYLKNPWNKIKLQAFTQSVIQTFTPSFLKKSRIIKNTCFPIFIVGMPRAGTTLIEQILSSHKSIYGAGELSLLDDIIQEACSATNLSFNNWVAQLTEQDFVILGEKYLNQISKLAPDKHYIVDKMPSNCFYIGMIYRMLPTAKIIHAIRDPMDSCFSCFTYLFKYGMHFAYDLQTLGNYYILYANVMQHWQAVLPKNTIFDVPYEKMVTDHESLSKQLLDYIELPWDSNCLQFYENKRIVKTASLAQVRKPIYKTSIQRWQHFAKQLKPLLAIVEPYRNIEGISS